MIVFVPRSLSLLWQTNVTWRRSASCLRRTRWVVYRLHISKTGMCRMCLRIYALNVLFVVRKSLQTCLQRESPSSRPAPWQRRASCRLKPRWETADSGSLWSRSVSSIWSHRGCHLSFRRATSSSLIASTPRWRARRSTMFSTGCTWPCPPRGMRRSVNQLLNGTLKQFKAV